MILALAPLNVMLLLAASVKLPKLVLTLVIFGCAAVVTVPAVVAAPLNAPTNVVAVIAPLLAFATKVALPY